MTIDIKWFQNRIRDLGTSQRRMSTAIATNPNTISMILNGKRKVTHEEIPTLAQLMDTTTEEILMRLGVDVPVGTKANTVGCIGTVDETGRVTIGISGRTAEAPTGSGASTKAVVFQGLGGDHPQHGWNYYFDETAKDKPVDADSLNALCLVEIGDKEGYHLGVVRRGLERGKFDLANAFTGERIIGGVVIRNASRITWIKA
ncbi:hypothetical protein LGH82_33145 [Mesorhizobium sp. PAMC28654]|uniref:helix-turn-helix domain-containing protein n=1 Tax=Mesorhizobium sp. PAMC28654 TaxID=2880934 RepID=UPI001D0A4FCD|nr:hypothetical protein [Mesorhizobium sp. PAMC28654]UDL89828.1 hypothetical protein LGH82_33145 [Mesorhizobium sp. PAMC28654]